MTSTASRRHCRRATIITGWSCHWHTTNLTELPEGLFLSKNLNITNLTLHGNPGSPFGINMVGEVLEDNVSNDGIRTARIRYVVREAAPVDMSADVSVTGGSVSESSVSVTAGEMYSGEMTVTQEVAGESAIVSLSNLTTGDISTYTKGVTFGVTSLTLFDDDAPVNTPCHRHPHHFRHGAGGSDPDHRHVRHIRRRRVD